MMEKQDDTQRVTRRTVLKQTAATGVAVTGLTATSGVVGGQQLETKRYVFLYDDIYEGRDWDYSDFVVYLKITSTGQTNFDIKFTPLYKYADINPEFKLRFNQSGECEGTYYTDEGSIDFGKTPQELTLFENTEDVVRRCDASGENRPTVSVFFNAPCQPPPLPGDEVYGTNGTDEQGNNKFFFDASINYTLPGGEKEVGIGDKGLRIIPVYESSPGFMLAYWPVDERSIWNVFEGVDEGPDGPVFTDETWYEHDNITGETDGCPVVP